MFAYKNVFMNLVIKRTYGIYSVNCKAVPIWESFVSMWCQTGKSEIRDLRFIEIC